VTGLQEDSAAVVFHTDESSLLSNDIEEQQLAAGCGEITSVFKPVEADEVRAEETLHDLGPVLECLHYVRAGEGRVHEEPDVRVQVLLLQVERSQ